MNTGIWIVLKDGLVPGQFLDLAHAWGLPSIQILVKAESLGDQVAGLSSGPVGTLSSAQFADSAWHMSTDVKIMSAQVATCADEAAERLSNTHAHYVEGTLSIAGTLVTSEGEKIAYGRGQKIESVGSPLYSENRLENDPVRRNPSSRRISVGPNTELGDNM
ncbi:hypothetical protein B0H16DRAFT_1787201 [Mycena metata]|uniref:Uncharacterized protein n=1 Tax=Mycena metata TaxID=1033252 RepID=A0AAD7JLY2_9AGAR|nr:hypothetical protein B0H16DRAFT_1787201 [Mycena metata]